MHYPLFYSIHDGLAVAALGFARVAPVFFILPFLNNGVLSGVIRTAVIMLVVIGMNPVESSEWLSAGGVPGWPVILREAAIGLLLGCLLSWPFWVFHAIGCIFDNQRGATLSSSIDPANGIDTSEMANFLNLFSAVIYLKGGGMLMVLETLNRSYQLCGIDTACIPSLSLLLGFVNQIITRALVLASPVLAALLLSEIVLGLLSRFAPQMNAFAISLTIKSTLTLFILLIYFSPVLSSSVMTMTFPASELEFWLQTEN
ncbi:SpaR/YscT/HrcT type III secretion system export apparatus protein [Salmonella enterica]|uniref:SpaR/YscT/HrcT type III secretion system export apparatus protein n=1 Tax=Salmonella enterica TaxID=28901 RepID=A0A759KBR2_SALER|nr:SpaR/YscT/HrcT type III secretion system export apparatus protein [Salmonella enterica subsp. enterica serovar Freetown]EBN9932878.1 SpaR/YscT/HrcT type III secretion system export apparatus protein [Salmonella enterica]EBS3610401.1 EscT/YscT/HrcT family type III secretion system export apparatus protein [Salmonella enterica subsp. enterica serovar Poona]EBH8792732.1 SpaR/YscT/HrcT type III secretion system export apparatus protein [Salmonella enterica subsp. enterica serovar Freetown]EBP084